MKPEKPIAIAIATAMPIVSGRRQCSHLGIGIGIAIAIGFSGIKICSTEKYPARPGLAGVRLEVTISLILDSHFGSDIE